MYKRIFVVLLAILFLIPNLFVYSKNADTNKEMLLGNLVETIEGSPADVQLSFVSVEDMVSNMSIVCSNNTYSFYWNKYDLTTAIVNNITGKIFTSNPYDASLDPMCTGSVKNDLESQIILSYYGSDFKKQNMWSSADCLSYGQYTAEIYDNGLAVNFSLGEDKSELIVPIALTVEDYEKYSNDLTSRQQRKLKAFYTLYKKGEYDVEENLKKYPVLSKKDLYILEGTLTERDKADISEIFIDAGYTYEKYRKNMEALGISIKASSFPNFKVRLEYILQDDGLIVNVPNQSIKYNKEFELLEISVLPFFGCDKPQENSDGYLFVPDGSGALININGQADTRQTSIAGRIYGDNPVTDKPLDLSNSKTYHLPVFGIVRNDHSAFLGIVTSGDFTDSIVALLGGPNGRYYTVYNRFLYTEYESSVTKPKIVSNGSTQNIYINDDNHYTCDYTVKYILLSQENSTYLGMAQAYREYLNNKNHILDSFEYSPQISVETIGSALINKDFLGVSYKSETIFTSYKNNVEILSDFKEAGIDAVSLKLLGWADKGLDASVSNKIRYSSKLGGKSEYKKLQEYCNEEDVYLSTSNNFVFTKFNRAFDGVGIKSSVAQTLERAKAEYFDYRSFPELKNKSRFIISPAVYRKYTNKLTKDALNNNMLNISLDALGKYLVADFSDRHDSNRQETIDEIKLFLESMSNKLNLSFDGANAYVLPYARSLSDVPCTSSGLAGESQSIPFIQLVLSGNVIMSSEAINLNGDMNSRILDCLRCGLIPKYIIAYDNIEKFKQTDYSHYYAVNYKYVFQDIVNTYKDIKEALNVIANNQLKNCYQITDGVYCSEYNDGYYIITNYNSEEYIFNGISIESNDFLLFKK